MIASLNEIRAMAIKAARGAGLSWGLAEEAGHATRWLMAHGAPGVDLLAGVLDRHDGAALPMPEWEGGSWRVAADLHCPLLLGVCLADDRAATRLPLTCGPVAAPVFLAPFLAPLGCRMVGPGLECAVSPVGLAFGNSPDAVATLTLSDGCPDFTCATHHARDVSGAAWDRLAALAHRTYAPATEASRQAGAGAGQSDND